MKKLIKLELKRNSLMPYHLCTIISTIIMLGFIYLMVAIPKMEPGDSDAELFSSYNFIIGLTQVVSMGIFSIMSAVMASKFVVEEYSGKKAILLFSYPISRDKILNVKILLVFLYTFLAMSISGEIILLVFMFTESLFPLCSGDVISVGLIIKSVLSLISYALISASCGVISLWFGFVKKSVITTIVTSCIIMVLICQIVAMSLFSSILIVFILLLVGLLTLLAVYNLWSRVRKMEI